MRRRKATIAFNTRPEDSGAATLTAEEFEEGGTTCPACGSEDVEQRLTAFYPINHKESA